MFFLLPLLLILIPLSFLDRYLNRPPVKGIQAYRGWPFIGCLLEVQTSDLKHRKMPKGIDKSRIMLTRPIFMKFFQWNDTKRFVLLEKPELPIFQFRLGFSWIVVVNNHEIYKDLIVKNSKKTDDRPVGESFHKILSNQNNVYTIGTTPKGKDYDSIKKLFQKDFLTNSNLDEHFSKIIIHECKRFLADVDGSVVDPLPHLQKFVSRISCWLCFGIDLNEALDEEYFDNDTATCGNLKSGIVSEIAFIEREIVKLRNPVTNGLDHLPKFIKGIFYRKTIAKIEGIKNRRNKYINKLYDLSLKSYKAKLDKKSQEPKLKSEECVQEKQQPSVETLAFENCLITKYLNNHSDFKKEHVLAICLTMMSAGLDNISSLMNNVIHRLSQGTADMEHLQMNAYEEFCSIKKTMISKMCKTTDELISDKEMVYSNEKGELDIPPKVFDLFENPYEEVQKHMDEFGKFAFIKSLMYENIRFLSVAPLGLPRITTDDVGLSIGIAIPKGTKIITNLYLMNHSDDHFSEPYMFNPYRFFKDEMCPCDHCAVQKSIEQLENISMPTLNDIDPGKTEVFQKKNLCPINGFGKGSRMCLGKRLAEYEMYYLLYYLLSSYKLKSVKTQFVPFQRNLHKGLFLSALGLEPAGINIQETDPRINNGCLDSISIEQKWNCLVSFESRKCIQKKERTDSGKKGARRVLVSRSISAYADFRDQSVFETSSEESVCGSHHYTNRRIVSIT